MKMKIIGVVLATALSLLPIPVSADTPSKDWVYMKPCYDYRIKLFSWVNTCLDKTDYDKTRRLYYLLRKYMQYDEIQAKDLYNPKYENTATQAYDRKMGVCRDYAVLYAHMCRYIGLDADIVVGYMSEDSKTFHAWNRVWVNNRWIYVDVTAFDTSNYDGYFDLDNNERVVTRIN